MSLERKKRYFVKHLNEPMARLCRILRVDRKTGYNWLQRFQAGGLEELLKNEVGGRPRQPVPSEIEKTVLDLRGKYGWNEKKIHRELENSNIEASFHAVRQTLAKAKVLGVAPSRTKRTFKKFERPLPNHLWAYDFSILDDGKYLFALIDDYSRYLVDAETFDSATTENALELCNRAFAQHGAPFQLMTDHGTQFWNNTRKCSNSFGPALEVWGVEHILAGVKHPQTNGKIERWFGVYKTESSSFNGLSEYIYHYNFCRPHAGIKYRKPYERYFSFKL